MGHKKSKNKNLKSKYPQKRKSVSLRILQILKNNLFWTIIGSVAAVSSIAYTIYYNYYDRKYNFDVCVGTFPLKYNENTELLYLLPISSNNNKYICGLLPLEIINTGHNNLKNFILEVATEFKKKESTSILENPYQQQKLEDKYKFARFAQLITQKDDRLKRVQIVDPYLDKDGFRYEIMDFYSLSNFKVFEHFIIDTTTAFYNDAGIKDFVRLQANCLYKNNKRKFTTFINLTIIDCNNIDEFAQKIIKIGQHPTSLSQNNKKIKWNNQYIITGSLYIDKRGCLCMNETEYKIYKIKYKNKPFSKNNILEIYDSNNNLIKEYQIKKKQ